MKTTAKKPLTTLTLTGLLAATAHSQLLIGPAKLTAPLDADGQPILNLPAPTLPAHPATKTYVDTILTTTAVLLTRTLTINGTTLDLSTDRAWTVGDVFTTASYTNPAWIIALDWSKITGTPTTIGGYGITDLTRTGTMPEVRIHSDTAPTPKLQIIADDGITPQLLLDISTASADYDTIAIGKSASVTAANSIAIGVNATANYTNSVAVGQQSNASSQNAVAVGRQSIASDSALAVGYNAQATATSAIQLGSGTNSASNTLQVFSYRLLESDGKIPPDRYMVSPPATATSPGEAGQIAYDSDYIYICVATNTWKRAALSAW